VNVYSTTCHYIPEDHTPHNHRYQNPNSNIVFFSASQFAVLAKYYMRDEMKACEMDRACRTHGIRNRHTLLARRREGTTRHRSEDNIKVDLEEMACTIMK
jgi:hypothetical protein